MVNGLSVLGWGVGGIEAEAAMLGQPLSMLLPEVIGFKLTGELKEGVTATDLVLTVTQMLRKKGVVGKFVEFYRPGPQTICRSPTARPSPTWRRNMARPAASSRSTTRRIDYLETSGRTPSRVALVEEYAKAQGLFRTRAIAGPGLHRHARARSWRPWCRRWPARSARKAASRSTAVADGFKTALASEYKKTAGRRSAIRSKARTSISAMATW